MTWTATLPWTATWLRHHLELPDGTVQDVLQALRSGETATHQLALDLARLEQTRTEGGQGTTSWDLPRALGHPTLPAELHRLAAPLPWSVDPGGSPAFEGTSADAMALVLSDAWAVCLSSRRLNAYHRQGTLHLALGELAPDIERAHAQLIAEGVDDPRFDADGDDIRLIDELYFTPTPSILDDDLAILFHRRDASREISIPASPGALTFFADLLPALRRTRSIAEVQALIGERWPMVDKLMAQGILEVAPRTAPQPLAGGRARFVAHSAILLETGTTRVLVDPMLLVRNRPSFNPLVHLDQPLDAILITHSHWDHFNLDGLLHIDRDAPILLPRRRSAESIVNLDMARVCREMGFTRVVELEPWDQHTVGDITLTAVPYFGEGFGPECPRDWMTFHASLAGRTVLGLVDACQDDFGSMDDALRELRERLGPVHVFFSPASGFAYPVDHFTRRPFRRSEQRLQFTGGAEETARWADIVEAEVVVPYALFHLEGSDVDQDEDALAADPFRHGSVAQVVERLPERARVLRPGQAITWETPGRPATSQP